MPERIGNNTIKLNTKPSIIGYGAVVGKKEAEGPLGNYFDKAYNDEFFGEKTFEKAVGELIKNGRIYNVLSLAGNKTTVGFSKDSISYYSDSELPTLTLVPERN